MELRVGLLAVLLATVSRAALAQDATALKRLEVKAGASTATIGTEAGRLCRGQVARGGRVGLLGNRDFMDTPFNITGYTAEMSGELLNETLFLGLDDARAKIASWFADYNPVS